MIGVAEDAELGKDLEAEPSTLAPVPALARIVFVLLLGRLHGLIVRSPPLSPTNALAPLMQILSQPVNVSHVCSNAMQENLMLIVDGAINRQKPHNIQSARPIELRDVLSHIGECEDISVAVSSMSISPVVTLDPVVALALDVVALAPVVANGGRLLQLVRG